MEQHFRQLIEQLGDANLMLRRQLEIAEATIPKINAQVQQLGALGLDGLVFAGEMIQSQPYLPSGPSDSGMCLQAVLLIPQGIGVATWDVCEYAELQRSPEGIEPEIATKFVSFVECSSLVKALLLSQSHDLLKKLHEAVHLRLQ